MINVMVIRNAYNIAGSIFLRLRRVWFTEIQKNIKRNSHVKARNAHGLFRVGDRKPHFWKRLEDRRDGEAHTNKYHWISTAAAVDGAAETASPIRRTAVLVKHIVSRKDRSAWGQRARVATGGAAVAAGAPQRHGQVPLIRRGYGLAERLRAQRW
jgi:hypothetical protein